MTPGGAQKYQYCFESRTPYAAPHRAVPALRLRATAAMPAD
jgi:hypothetical protein